MTAILVALAANVLALVPLGAFVGFCHTDSMWNAHERELARLTAPLAPPREDLTSERVNDEYPGRHRYGTAIGSSAQAAGIRALREPTDAFAVLVAANWDTGEREALAWRCDSCRVGWDTERPHASCGGCGCPCTLVPIGRPPLVGAL